MKEKFHIWVIDNDAERVTNIMSIMKVSLNDGDNYSAKHVSPKIVENLPSKLPDLVLISEQNQQIALDTVPRLQNAAQQNPNLSTSIVVLSDKTRKKLEEEAYKRGVSYIETNANPKLVSLRIGKEIDAAIRTRTLQTDSLVDPLTGSYNRRAMDKHMKYFWKLAIERQLPFSFIILDIDKFKPYNDNYGHVRGDTALKKVAKILRQSLREEDFVARYGGEEFAVLLPNTGTDGAIKIAEKLKQAIYNANIPHGYSDVTDRITISLGVGTTQPDHNSDYQKFIKIVDQSALYVAKADDKKGMKGRNRYIHIDVDPTQIRFSKRQQLSQTKKIDDRRANPWIGNIRI